MSYKPTLRIKRIRVTGSVILALMRGEARVTTSIPADISVYCFNDSNPWRLPHDEYSSVWLWVGSEEFEPIEEGEVIPELELQFERAGQVAHAS